eukprot:scaffold207569_cov23-Tisochrysis_lutea.AAC.1
MDASRICFTACDSSMRVCSMSVAGTLRLKRASVLGVAACCRIARVLVWVLQWLLPCSACLPSCTRAICTGTPMLTTT